jgi:hypothetical protein
MELIWIIALTAIIVIDSALFISVFRGADSWLVLRKQIGCPQDNRDAVVEFFTRAEDSGPYRGVYSCSLKSGARCAKRCLTSTEALQAPLMAVTRRFIWEKV